MIVLALAACQEYRFSKDPDEELPPADTAAPPPVVETTPPAPTTPTEPVAEAPVYANTTGHLFEIDPATGERTLVGSFHDDGGPISGMVDIAIDLEGRIFGGNYDAIWQIDPTTAAATRVCDTDLAPYALAFSSDGVLFAGAGADVVRVELPGCGETALLSGSAYETSGDLVGLPDGFLYWTVLDGDFDGLVRVDPTSGATAWVGGVGGAKLFGLGYDQGTLYGFSSEGEILAIDPATAATTTLSSDGTAWWGATTNPVVW